MEKTNEKTKKRGSGFGLRLTMAIILYLFGIAPVAIVLFVLPGSPNYYGVLIEVSLAAGFFLMAALQTMFAIAGKKRRWGNIGSIVIGSIWCACYGLGVFAIIGGIKGLDYIRGCAEIEKSNAEKNALNANAKDADVESGKSENGAMANAMSDDSVSAQAPVAETAAVGCVSAQPITAATAATAADGVESADKAEEVAPQEVLPKRSAESRRKIMRAVICIYGALFVFSVLLIAVPPVKVIISGIGIARPEASRAYSIMIGLVWLCLTPTILYYFATIAPKQPQTSKGCIILFAIGLLCSVISIVLYFVITSFVNVDGLPLKAYYEGSDNAFMPLGAVAAQVGIIVCYALTIFKIDIAKLTAKKPDTGLMTNGNGVLARLHKIVRKVQRAIKRFLKWIFVALLKLKQRDPDMYAIVVTMLLTWLWMFTAAILLILLMFLVIGAYISFITGALSIIADDQIANSSFGRAFIRGYTGVADKYTFTNDFGCTQTVYTDNGRDFYSSSGSYVGHSDDDGKTIVEG